MVSKTTVLTVAIGLVLATLGGLAAICLLARGGDPVPASLETLTGTALGALAMTLGNARSTLGKADIEPTPMVPQPKVPEPEWLPPPPGTDALVAMRSASDLHAMSVRPAAAAGGTTQLRGGAGGGVGMGAGTGA